MHPSSHTKSQSLRLLLATGLGLCVLAGLSGCGGSGAQSPGTVGLPAMNAMGPGFQAPAAKPASLAMAMEVLCGQPGIAASPAFAQPESEKAPEAGAADGKPETPTKDAKETPRPSYFSACANPFLNKLPLVLKPVEAAPETPITAMAAPEVEVPVIDPFDTFRLVGVLSHKGNATALISYQDASRMVRKGDIIAGSDGNLRVARITSTGIEVSLAADAKKHRQFTLPSILDYKPNATGGQGDVSSGGDGTTTASASADTAAGIVNKTMQELKGRQSLNQSPEAEMQAKGLLKGLQSF